MKNAFIIITMCIVLCLCGGCQNQQKLSDVVGFGRDPSDAEINQRLRGLRLTLLHSTIAGVGSEGVWFNEDYRIDPGETGKYPPTFKEAWEDITPYFLNNQLKDVKLMRLEPPTENRIYKSDEFTLSMFISTSVSPTITGHSRNPSPKDPFWYLHVVRFVRVSP